MPIYDYVCQSCGTTTEVIHGVHEQGPETCAACGGSLRRAVSVPSIVFKGTGWAKKDARPTSGRGPSDKHSTSDGGPPGDQKATVDKSPSDSKPAGEQGTATDTGHPAAG